MRNQRAVGSDTCVDVPKPRVRRLKRCVFALGAVCVLFATMALTAGDDKASRNMAGSGVICASSALGIGDHEWLATPMGPPPELACASVSAPEEWLGSNERITKIMAARISRDPLDPRLKLRVQAYARDERFSHLWLADASVDSDPLGAMFGTSVTNTCLEVLEMFRDVSESKPQRNVRVQVNGYQLVDMLMRECGLSRAEAVASVHEIIVNLPLIQNLMSGTLEQGTSSPS